MVEINRIGGPSEPAHIEREEVRRKQAAQQPPASQDAVSISAEARTASNIVQFSEAIKNLPDIRQERVTRARQNLEQGLYTANEVVRMVAARISKYVVNE